MNELVQWLTGLFRGIRPWVVVFPWERAVRMRFGKYVRLLEPGMHFKLPYFDDVVVVNTRLRVSAPARQTLTTRDGRTLTVSVIVGFRVTDPLLTFRRYAAPTGTVNALAASALADHVTRAHGDDATSERAIVAGVLKRLRESAGDGLAFDFVSVGDLATVRTYRLIADQGHTVGVWGDDNARPGVQAY